MSEENVAVVRQMTEAFNARELLLGPISTRGRVD